MQVVDDLRVEPEERVGDVLTERQRHADLVPVVVVHHVVPPVDERRRGQVGMRLAVVPEVDLAVAPVGLDDRGQEHDDVFADVLDERRLLDRQPVGELHHHLGAAGLGRVDGPGRVVERLALRDQLLRLALREPARIGELGRDVAIVIQVANRLGVGDCDDDHLPALFTLPHREDLDARRSLRQRPHVLGNVFGVGQMPLGAGDVAMVRERRRHRRRGRQVVHQLGHEPGLGGLLPDRRGIRLVDRLLRDQRGGGEERDGQGRSELHEVLLRGVVAAVQYCWDVSKPRKTIRKARIRHRRPGGGAAIAPRLPSPQTRCWSR